MSFDLSNYVDVSTRLVMALEKWPSLRIQETQSEVVTMPDGSCFIRCSVTVWRDETDPIPSIGSAAEPYPGKTPYTKSSEHMVGFTSALGRALGYMGIGINKAIASRNEVEARQNMPDAEIKDFKRPTEPTSSGNFATPKQLNYLRSLAKERGFSEGDLLAHIHRTLNRDDVVTELLSKSQAAKIIETLLPQ